MRGHCYRKSGKLCITGSNMTELVKGNGCIIAAGQLTDVGLGL